MAQHTVFVEFFYPSNVNDILWLTTDDELKKACFVVTKYATPEEALYAYEHTQASWSIILDDDQDFHEFIDEAYEALKNNDWRWLYKHFV